MSSIKETLKNVILGHGHHDTLNRDSQFVEGSTTGTTATTGFTETKVFATGNESLRGDLRGESYQTTVKAPIVSQTVERPAVVNQEIHKQFIEEVQPVIHKERLQREVHQVEQPIMQKEVLPTVQHTKSVPMETRPVEYHAPTAEFTREYSARPQSSVNVVNEGTRVVERAPIVQETIKKEVVNEIQPIINKEVIEQHVIHTTKPIYEKVVEAPTLVREVKPVVYTTEQRPMATYSQTVLPTTTLPSTTLPSTSYTSTSLPSTNYTSTALPSTNFTSTTLPSTNFTSTSLPSAQNTSKLSSDPVMARVDVDVMKPKNTY